MTELAVAVVGAILLAAAMFAFTHAFQNSWRNRYNLARNKVRAVFIENAEHLEENDDGEIQLQPLRSEYDNLILRKEPHKTKLYGFILFLLITCTVCQISIILNVGLENSTWAIVNQISVVAIHIAVIVAICWAGWTIYENGMSVASHERDCVDWENSVQAASGLHKKTSRMFQGRVDEASHAKAQAENKLDKHKFETRQGGRPAGWSDDDDD